MYLNCQLLTIVHQSGGKLGCCYWHHRGIAKRGKSKLNAALETAKHILLTSATKVGTIVVLVIFCQQSNHCACILIAQFWPLCIRVAGSWGCWYLRHRRITKQGENRTKCRPRKCFCQQFNHCARISIAHFRPLCIRVVEICAIGESQSRGKQTKRKLRNSVHES